MIDSQLTSGGPLALVEQLAALVRRRVEDEQAIAAAHALRIARSEAQRDQRRGDADRKYEARRAAAEQPQTMQAEVLRQYDAERASVGERLQQASRKMRRRYRQRLRAATKKRDRIHAGEMARFAARHQAAEERVSATGELTAMRRVAIAELALEADKLLAQRGLKVPEKYESPDDATFDRDQHEIFGTAMKRGAAAVAQMRSLTSVRMAGAQGLLLGFIAGAIVGAIIAGLVWGFGAWSWLGGAALLCGVVGSLIVNRAAVPLARKQSLASWSSVRGALAAAQAAAASAHLDAKDDAQTLLTTLAEKRDRKLNRAGKARSKEAMTTKATLERKLAANLEKVTARLAKMDRERDSAITSATVGLPQRLAQLDEQRQASLAALDEEHARRVAESTSKCDEELEEVAADWADALRRWEANLAALDARCQRHCPPWSTLDGDAQWTAPASCDDVRFGEYVVSPADFLPADAVPETPAWASTSTYALPALLSFHERPALVVQSAPGERLRGSDAAYNVVLRVIAALGAGGVRCTILDPQRSGARFERLDRLVGGDDVLVRLLTTDWEIEQALTEHRQHIERVRQMSGELNELQRVLVVLGALAAESMATLKQIIAHGACGGVTTLVNVDACATGEFDGVASQTLALVAVEREFRLQHPSLGALRVALDEPPSAAVAARLVRRQSNLANGHAAPVYAGVRR